MLLALSRSVAEFEPRLHLADGGATTRPAGLEEVARAFRLSMRGTRPAQAARRGCLRHPQPDATLFEVSLCLPTAPALLLWGTETSERRRFLGSSRASSCRHVHGHVGCPGVKHNGGPRINQVWSLLSGPSSPKRRPLRRFSPRCQSRSRQHRQFRARMRG